MSGPFATDNVDIEHNVDGAMLRAARQSCNGTILVRHAAIGTETSRDDVQRLRPL